MPDDQKIPFDYLGARKSGYSDDEIKSFLKQKYSFDFDITNARKSGYSDKEIADYITAYEPEKKKGLLSSGALGVGSKIRQAGSLIGGVNGSSQSNGWGSVSSDPMKGIQGKLDPEADARIKKYNESQPSISIKPITNAGINLEHDDPLGELIKPSLPHILSGFSNDKRNVSESTGQLPVLKSPKEKSSVLTPQQERHIATTNIDLAEKSMQHIFPDGKVAEEYLQNRYAKDGKLPENNATVNYAFQKANELEDWNKKLTENPDLTHVAVDIARGNDENLDKQITALEQGRFAGHPNIEQRKQEVKQAGYYYDNMLPPEQQAAYTDQLIHDPNTKLIAEKNPAVKQQLDYLLNGGLYERFPAYGKNKILNEVSQEYERENNKWVFDPASPYKDKKLNDIADKLYANQPALKKIVDENFRDNWAGKIDNPTITSRFAEGFTGAAKGQGSSLLDWAGLGPSKSERVYHNLQNEFSGVSAGESGFKKDVGSAANFAGMITEMAVGAKVVGATKAMSPAITGMALNASTFYDGLKDQYTMMFPDNAAKAETGATLSTLAFTFAYKAFPSTKLAEAVSKKMQPEVAEVLSSLESGAVSKEAKANFLSKLKDVTVGTLGKNFEGVAQMTAITAGQNAFDQAIGITPEAQKKYEQSPVTVARNMAIGLAVPSLIQSVGGINAAAKNVNRVADSPMMYKRALDGMLRDRVITQKQYDKTVGTIDHLATVKQEMIDNGTPEKNMGRALLESLHQKQLAESKPTDPVLLKQHNEKIKDSQEIQQRVMAGENPDTIITESQQKIIDEKEKTDTELERLKIDNELDNKKVDAKIENTDGRKSEENRVKLQELKEEKRRINEDYEKQVAKLTPKETLPDQVREVDNGMTPPVEKASNTDNVVEIGTTDNTNTILEKAEKKGGIYSELAKAIKGFLGNVKTVVTDAFKSDVSEHGDYGQNEIAINNKTNKNKLHIFFHEALHHITREKIQDFESNPNSKNLKPHEVSAIIDLKRIFKKVTEKLNQDEGGFGTQKGGQSPKNMWLLDATGNKRGLANVHEFISEAFTNPEFQKILKDFKGEGKSPTIFKQFLDAVAKMLGLKDPTILDDIFHHTEKLTEQKSVESTPKGNTSNVVEGSVGVVDVDFAKRKKEMQTEYDKLQKERFALAKERDEIIGGGEKYRTWGKKQTDEKINEIRDKQKQIDEKQTELRKELKVIEAKEKGSVELFDHYNSGTGSPNTIIYDIKNNKLLERENVVRGKTKDISIEDAARNKFASTLRGRNEREINEAYTDKVKAKYEAEINDEITKFKETPKAEDKAPVTKPEGKSDVVVDKASNVGGDVEKYSESKRYNSEIKVGQKYYDNRYGDFYTIEKLTPVEGGDVDATLKYDKGKTRTESGNFLLYHIDAKQHSLSKEQPIVAEIPKQEKTNDYYIYDFDNKEFVKTENAKPVKLDTEGDFFAVKEDNGYYTIYEGTSGQGIGQSGKLLRDAIKNANESIERNSKAGFPLEMAISGGIKRNGQSPRVEQPIKKQSKVDQPLSSQPLTEVEGGQTVETTSEVKDGFTEGEDLNKIYAGLKSKYGDKKGAAIYEAANRLVNPNTNTIVEIRGNGVVVKEGGKYILKPFGNTDANMKKWTLYKGLDVTDQFAKQSPSKQESGDKASNGGGDVEATAKALEKVQKTENPTENQVEEFKKIRDSYYPKDSKVLHHGSSVEKLERDTDGLIWFTNEKKVADDYRKRSVVSNKANLDEYDADVMESKSAIETIADEQGIDLSKGKVFSGQVKMDNVIDLTDKADDGNISNLPKLWNKLHEKGLVEKWEDIDQDYRDELIDEYQGKATWRLLEEEGIYDDAKKKGYDGVVISDVGIDGKIHKAYGLFNLKNFYESSAKGIAEAYHKAKADGSNPELVKAVEQSLSKPSTPTVQEGKVEQKTENNGTQKANEEGGGSDQPGKQQAEEIIPPVKPVIEEGEGTIPPEGGKVVESEQDPELTKIANAVNDEFVKGNFGTDALDNIISQLQDTDLSKTYDAVKEKVKQGVINPKLVRERVTTNKSGNAADQAVLLYDMAELKGRDKAIRKAIIESTNPKEKLELQRQLEAVQNEMMDNALANRFIGRDWHNIGKIRQQWINKDFNIVDMQQEYMASKGISELTPEQKAEIQGYHDAIKNLEVQRDKAKDDLDKAVAETERLKAENEALKKLKGKSPRVKRSEEQIAESNKRVQKAKDELKNLRQGMNDVTRVLPKTAALIGRIAAEKVYQGVIEFRELVRDILDDVKEIFPEWTEKDVAAHILNETAGYEKYYEAGKKYDTSNKELQEKIKAYNKVQKEYALKMYEWQKDRRSDLNEKKPIKEKIINNVLSWQRFAILSYPSTMVKLVAVVGHQLVLKPFKFGIQKFITAPISKAIGIHSKQTLWAEPTWRSLAKYYSAFIRNFSLANLKEQFRGIDTKEILYGNSFMYDEWAAAKGFLEIPGRSHGYIKSFIKNPEFQFAQENIATQHISKMAEIETKLKDDAMPEKEKTKLKDEYENWDISNPDIMEKINKLSLEHGKWAILMNDNNFTKKFQSWVKDNGFSGALAKSELPIIKIPLNFIYRAFATKYGLIRAIIGKGRWESKENNFPGLVEMAFKGTKELTPKQADIFGRAISLGSMGATFFTMGYLMRHNIQANDDGSYDIFGMHINKNLSHSPELESIFSGAETGHEFDKKGGKGADNWIKSFVESDIDIAKKSPFVSMMKYGFTANLANALISKSDNDKVWGKITDATAKKIADMVVPGFVKQSAAAMDVKGKNYDIFSKPENRWPKGTDLERFWQTFELGIPGLRQNVPSKQSNSPDIPTMPTMKKMPEAPKINQ